MNKSEQSQIVKSIFKTLTILHFAFCASILLFGSAVLYITENAQLNLANSEDVFFYVLPIFAITGIFVGQFLFQKNLKTVHEKTLLTEKLSLYQSSKIIQYAMIEAPAFLGIVIFLSTTNQFYIIISAILLAYLVILRPTKPKIIEDLKLNAEQARLLR